MAFNKINYIDGVTPIEAKNLNAIQDELIALGGLVRVDNQIAKRNATESSPLVLSDALPSSLLSVSIKQTVFPSVPGVNKWADKTVSNDWMQNASCYLSDYVEVGQEAIFSFDVVGDVNSLNPTVLVEDEYGPTFAEGVDHTIKTTEGSRYYIELKGHNKPIIGINMGISDSDTETYLDNCALRYDGSTEYVPYETIKTTYNPAEVNVVEITTGQSSPADAAGKVGGFTSSADGTPMRFKLDKYANYFTLTIAYQRSISAVIEELRTQLASAVSQLNVELADLTDTETETEGQEGTA